MTETKQTPGPWVVDGHWNFKGVYSDDATGSIVAQVAPFEIARRPDDEVEANARLIAASPELLDALRLILPLAKGYAAQNRVGSNAEYIEAAEAAIAKAEGR